MSRELNETEQALVELVHYLALKTDLPVNKIKVFLNTQVAGSKSTVLEHLDSEGRAFVNRLKIFINQSEDP